MVAGFRLFLATSETAQRYSREILGLCLGRSLSTRYAMTVIQAHNLEARLFAIVERTVKTLCADLQKHIMINKYSSGVAVAHTEESLWKAGTGLQSRMQTAIARLDKP